MTTPSTDTTICPLCAVGCSLAYEPESGRATGRSGPVNPNRRLCPKGIQAFHHLSDSDRITQPYLRQDATLQPASWDTVYQEITTEFTQIIDTSGPDALAFLGSAQCTIEENYLFQKLARLLGTNNVDNRARVCHAGIGAVMRDRLGSDAMTNSLTDLQQASAFLIVGANPADAQPVAFDSYIRPAVADGATLIHIDPRATATTRIADFHLTPHPGRDADVLTAMAAATHRDGLADMGFIATRTTGYDEFTNHLQQIDPVAVAASAGVEPDTLNTATRVFAESSKGAALIGTGLEPSGHERSPAADAVLNLLLLTGNIGKPGTGMNLLRGRNNEQGAIDAGSRPFSLPGGHHVRDPVARARLGETWGREPPSTPGLSEPAVFHSAGGDIRGIWVFGENPGVSTLDVDIQSRLDSLDYLVVQDTDWTETVAHADAVLPASGWAEKTGTVTNLDRQVQRLQSLGEPPGEARRDLRIISELGVRFIGESFEYNGSNVIFEEFCRVAPSYGGLSAPETQTYVGRWPRPTDTSGEIRVLHRARFENGNRRAPFLEVPVTGEPDVDRGLVLLTGAIRTTFQGRGSVSSERTVQIHPDDAEHRGISDGDTIRLSTDTESITATASVSPAVRSGTVFAPAGSVEAIAQENLQRVELTLEHPT